jgi:hypothetical protein
MYPTWKDTRILMYPDVSQMYLTCSVTFEENTCILTLEARAVASRATATGRRRKEPPKRKPAKKQKGGKGAAVAAVAPKAPAKAPKAAKEAPKARLHDYWRPASGVPLRL